jgi:hypothetical protein
VRPADPLDLRSALTHAFALLRQAEACSVALADLGDIELPSRSEASDADRGTMRAVATLYLASELESAMLIPAVEIFCNLAMTGGVTAELGDASGLIATFWQHRTERFTAAERRAFFDHLFDEEFETRFIDLCEALYKLDENAVNASYGGPQQQTRLRIATTSIVDLTLKHGGGLNAYVARDCLSTSQSALTLLNHPRVQQAFGVHAPWDVVRTVASRYMQAEPAIESHVGRGRSGVIVLAWVADVLPLLSQSTTPVLGLGDPVIAAAFEWLQTSLDLTETPHGAGPSVAATPSLTGGAIASAPRA